MNSYSGRSEAKKNYKQKEDSKIKFTICKWTCVLQISNKNATGHNRKYQHELNSILKS